MKSVIKFFVFGGLLATSITQAQDVQVVANQIAETFGYPANRLIVTDESAKYAEKTKGQAVQVISMKSNDGTFASTGIAITRRGALLKPDLEEECKERLAEGSTSVRRFDLNQGVYGYAGIGIAGPGGSEELLIATWPDRGIDLQIKMTIPREGLAVEESTKAYHTLVMSDAPALSAKLIDAMGRLADYAGNADIRFGGGAKGDEQKGATESSTQSHTENPPPPSTQDSALAATSDEPSPSPRWPLVAVVVVAAFGLLWFLLKKRK